MPITIIECEREPYMFLTKRRLVLLTFTFAAVFFISLLFMPESIIGHRDDNLLLFIPKILFLAITAAIVMVLLLIITFRRDYVAAQIDTLNRYQHYLGRLIKRDFTAKYRKSILGVLWSLLNPLLTMLVMSLVFSHFFRFEIETGKFPVYLLSGMIIYTFFNESTTMAMTSVIASEGVIKKVYVPKYMFPLSRVISTLVNLAFSLIAFFFVVLFTGSPFYWTMLLIPIPIAFIFIFSLGVAMLLSSLAVFFRDLTYLYGVFTLLLMYFTPIFWPISMLDPESVMPSIIGLNPLFQFISYFRSLTMDGVIPGLWANMVCLGYALAVLCLGTYVFIRQQDKYILSM